jgi:hypothetical protein
LKNGYDWAYKEFYSWANIFKSSFSHDSHKHKLKHLFYTGGWKKFEPVWNFLIKTKSLNNMLPILESILARVNPSVSKTLTIGENGFSQQDVVKSGADVLSMNIKAETKISNTVKL